MATIHYQFADGHFEDIEVTEEFKREYEFLEIQERAHYWKIKKQKQAGGLGSQVRPVFGQAVRRRTRTARLLFIPAR